jgi:outer membrane lipoprotein-sorting protein
LLFSGCAGILKRPVLSTDQISIPQIRHRIEQNYLKFQTLKAKARISIESPQMSFTANATVFLKKPDTLKIQISAGFGLGFGAVFVDSKQFLLYNSFENVVYSGCPDSIELPAFLPVDVKLDDLLQFFSGLQLLKTFKHEVLAIDQNKFLVTGSDEIGALKFWIDPKKFVMTQNLIIDSTNKTILQLDYQKFYKHQGVQLPKTIRLYQPERKTRVTIFFVDLDINAQFKETDFFIKIPENAERVAL